jgi:two-component system chemotaxis response regulator CheY
MEKTAVADAATAAKTHAATVPLFNCAHVLDHLQGNRELLREVVTIFLVEAPPLLHELRVAFEKSIPDEVRRCAHSLKGMFANIGVQALADDCHAIQDGVDDVDLSELFGIFCHVEQNYPVLGGELRRFIHVSESAPLVAGKARVLIVEDDFMTRHLLKKLLSEYGSIDIAIDGNEAVLAFRSALEAGQPYDLICMDIKMKRVDGQEALKRIRAIEAEQGVRSANEVKVIMVTSLDDPKSVVEAMYRGGATSYITKPVDTGKLVAELKDLGLVKAA